MSSVTKCWKHNVNKDSVDGWNGDNNDEDDGNNDDDNGNNDKDHGKDDDDGGDESQPVLLVHQQMSRTRGGEEHLVMTFDPKSG